jgi:hypothetical protein
MTTQKTLKEFRRLIQAAYGYGAQNDPEGLAKVWQDVRILVKQQHTVAVETERKETINEVLVVLTGLGIGGKGKYEDGFRDALEFAIGNVEALLPTED